MNAVNIKVATFLLERWKDKLRIDLRPESPDEIADGLGQLATLFPNDIKLEGDDLEKVAGEIEKVVSLVQIGLGMLPDGVMGKKLLRRVFHNPSCGGTPPIKRSDDNRVAADLAEEKTVWAYFVERLPAVPGSDTSELVTRAWKSWRILEETADRRTEAKVTFRRVDDRERSNVVITTAFIDGAGNILAKATVGPPGPFNLTLTFDEREDWNEAKFLATAQHEIGHLLGFHHSLRSDQLMSPFLVSGITGLRDEDKQRMRTRYGVTDLQMEPEVQPTNGAIAVVV